VLIWIVSPALRQWLRIMTITAVAVNSSGRFSRGTRSSLSRGRSISGGNIFAQ